MSWGPATETSIGRLRVRAYGLDRQAAEVRAASQLRLARLAPASLPEHAVLCVRRVRDPRPGQVALGDASQALPIGWELAVRDVLESAARTAARPAQERVTSSAGAVLFADQAELLACLASDLCGGQAQERWWWRSLYQTRDLERVLLDAWLESPGLAPAGLEHLARRGQVVDFARRLTGEMAGRLLAGIAGAFGLIEVGLALAQTCDRVELPAVWLADASAPPPPELPRTRSGAHGQVQQLRAGRSTDGLLRRVEPPWQRWVPESAHPSLHPQQRLLLGFGLLVRRAPTVARTRAFLHALQAWSVADLGSTAAAVPVASPPPDVAAASAPVASAPDSPRRSTSAASNASSPSLPVGPSLATLTADPLASGASSESRPLDGAVLPLKLVTPGFRARTPVPGPSRTLDDGTPPPAVRGADLAPEVGLEGTLVTTRLGGIFYLINLGLALELYGDFTQPGRPGIALPLWDFLTVVARRLLGRRRHPLDPAWQLLAALAGRRRRDPPGASFTPPAAWRLPAEWLAPIADRRAWRWSVLDERLRVRHPAGFLVVDVPRSNDHPRVQLAAELHPYGPRRVRQAKRGAGAGAGAARGPLQGWLNWLMPYVRARLRSALDVGRETRVGELICVQPAQVSLTSVNLDVFLSLAELPIMIRLAGLDRDPGWVPAAGRSIAFHFD